MSRTGSGGTDAGSSGGGGGASPTRHERGRPSAETSPLRAKKHKKDKREKQEKKERRRRKREEQEARVKLEPQPAPVQDAEPMTVETKSPIRGPYVFEHAPEHAPEHANGQEPEARVWISIPSGSSAELAAFEPMAAPAVASPFAAAFGATISAAASSAGVVSVASAEPRARTARPARAATHVYLTPEYENAADVVRRFNALRTAVEPLDAKMHVADMGARGMVMVRENGAKSQQFMSVGDILGEIDRFMAVRGGGVGSGVNKVWTRHIALTKWQAVVALTKERLEAGTRCHDHHRITFTMDFVPSSCFACLWPGERQAYPCVCVVGPRDKHKTAWTGPALLSLVRAVVFGFDGLERHRPNMQDEEMRAMLAAAGSLRPPR